MQPTRMDDFPHVFIQLPESSCKMHTKQEGVMGGHAMTKQGSAMGGHSMAKTRKCHGWACHDKQENIMGGHAMQNKEVSWVGVP